MEIKINGSGGTEGASRIGLGCVTFGREINAEAAFAFMDYAYAKGINFFDTAAVYGKGASEEIIGAWLRSRRPNHITVATKILPPFTADAVDLSLQRLQLAAIDLLYLHRWDESIENEEVKNTFINLLKEGKVRALGASNFTAVQLKSTDIPFQYIQNNHNLAVSELTPELLAICAERNTRIVTYSPLGAGFLTGKHLQGVESGSRFDIMPGHQQVYFNEAAQKRLKKLQEVSLRTGHSMIHLALAWALHQKDVASVLIGGRNASHLDQALKALEFNDPQIFSELIS